MLPPDGLEECTLPEHISLLCFFFKKQLHTLSVPLVSSQHQSCPAIICLHSNNRLKAGSLPVTT
eukprot:XP_001708159.1 Hypothetical protein GL50803_35364 [Giardia lamblia ATCC 50803]